MGILRHQCNDLFQEISIWDALAFAENIETNVDLESQDGGFALAGRVRARSTSLFKESVRNFLGGNAVAASDVRYGPDGVIRFSNLSLRAPAVRITGGNGFYAPDGRLALNADGITDAYGRVGVRVAGTLTDPQAVVTAERPDFGIGLANVRDRLHALFGERATITSGESLDGYETEIRMPMVRETGEV